MRKISREDIMQCATRMLEVLEAQGVTRLESLESLVGMEFTPAALVHHGIIVSIRPSNPFPIGCAVSLAYVWGGFGIPIEAKVNRIMEYTNVIVKCSESLDGYVPFGMCPKGRGILQERQVVGAQYACLKLELESLAKPL